MGRWRHLQALPIYPGNEPLPLRRGEVADRRIRAGPDESALMQSAMTEPDAGAVPDQQLDASQALVAEGISTSVTGRLPKAVLDPL